MPNTLIEYSIFLASPGDLEEERRVTRQVVARFSEEIAATGVRFVVVGWEDVAGGATRPQSKINDVLRRSDLAIFLFGEVWGSPTGDSDHGVSSGTEEEWSLAEALRKSGQLTDLSLFFRVPPKSARPDPKILEFRQSLVLDKTVYFEQFSSRNDYIRRLERKLREWLGSLATPRTGASSQGKAVAQEEVIPLLQEGMSLRERGFIEEAEVPIARAALLTQDANAALSYGRLLIRKGRLPLANVYLELAAGRAADKSDRLAATGALLGLGAIAHLRADGDSARQHFRKALHLTLRSEVDLRCEGHHSLAVSYLSDNLLDLAIVEIDALQEQVSNASYEQIRWNFEYLGGVLRTRKGDTDAAHRVFEDLEKRTTAGSLSASYVALARTCVYLVMGQRGQATHWARIARARATAIGDLEARINAIELSGTASPGEREWDVQARYLRSRWGIWAATLAQFKPIDRSRETLVGSPTF